MKLLFSIIALILTTTLLSQQPITNNTSNDSVYAADARIQLHDLKNYTSVFTDSSNKLTIQEIASEKFSNQFQPLSGMVQPAQPYITYWLKLSISASGDIQNWWLLLNNDPEFKEYTALNCYVDAWFLNNGNQVAAHQRTGFFVPRSQKTIKEKPGLNRVLFTAKDGETKNVYLRIYNEYGPAIISLPQLRNPVAGIPGSNMPWVFFFSGGIFFFSVISFFLFFFGKRKSLSLFWILYSDRLAALSYYSSRYSIC
jgi:hypothetical protein